MRRFVAILAAFGVVLIILVVFGYVYFVRQIPPVQIQTDRYQIRADSIGNARAAESTVRTAVNRFARLFGPSTPPLDVAIVDDAGQMNAVAIYLALRKEMGTPPERLPLPLPSTALSRIEASDPDTPLRNLGHEIGHWLLASYSFESGIRSDGTAALPPWLVEGVAGYCETDESRLRQLQVVRNNIRAARSKSDHEPSLEWLFNRANPAGATGDTSAEFSYVNGNDGTKSTEAFIATAALIVSYLEDRQPGRIRELTDRFLASEVRASTPPPVADAGEFDRWVDTLSLESL